AKRSASQWAMIRYAYLDARRYGALRGLTVRGTVKIWDTTLPGMGLLWVKRQSDSLLRRYLETTYDRFWKRALGVEDPAVVEGVLREVGADTAGFRAHVASEDRARYEAWQEEIFDAGVFGVPGYVVEREYYWGREHLPRIRWILGGRKGAAPDVAY